eukprot:scpid6936/ scgid3290/ Leucine-rich repeat serine/threonine-protein kinase 1
MSDLSAEASVIAHDAPSICAHDLDELVIALKAIDDRTVADSPESQHLLSVSNALLARCRIEQCLTLAAKHGYHTIVDYFIRRHTDTMQPVTLALAMCISVLHSNAHSSSLLKSVCRDLQRQSIPDPVNPVLVACAAGKRDAVIELMENTATLPPSSAGITPLVIACACGQTDTVRYLMSKGEDLSWSRDAQDEFLFDGELNLTTVRIGRDLLETCLLNAQHQLALFLLSRGLSFSADVQHDVACQEALKKCLAGRLTEAQDGDELPAPVDEPDGALSGGPIQAAWDNLGLVEMKLPWISHAAATLVQLNIADNKISHLPPEVFSELPSLTSVNVSYNCLVTLTVPDRHDSLTSINAASNAITSLSPSIFQLPKLTTLTLSQNSLSSLCGAAGDDHSECASLVSNAPLAVVDVSANKLSQCLCPLNQLPMLTELNVAKNEIKTLPAKWKTNCFKRLIAFSNRLEDFAPTGNFTRAECPASFQVLELLNLSKNCLKFVPLSACAIPHLSVLDLSHNRLSTLPPPYFWQCSLTKLDLSNNCLVSNTEVIVMDDTDDGIDEDDRYMLYKSSAMHQLKNKSKTSSPLDRSNSSSEQGWLSVSGTRNEGSTEFESGKFDEIQFPVQRFATSLAYLRLDHNKLENIPPSICQLLSLVHLDLSHNPDLTFFLPSLGNLRNCFQIGIRGLSITNVPRELLPGSPSGNTRRALAYLRATLRQSEPYNRIKLMVVGLEARGKTSLLARLRGEPLPSNVSTVGVKVDNWELKSSAPAQQPSKGPSLFRRVSLSTSTTSSDDSSPIVLSTWDMAGQVDYYATHQCFLSSNTLYLAVWKLTSGETGVASLKTWLVNIQARAPGSAVIIVGTHLDQLSQVERERKKYLTKMNALIKSSFIDQKGYPKIVGVVEVSNTKLEGIATLQQKIYEAASNITDPDSKEKLVRRKVPASYLCLQHAVMARAQQMKENDEVPILDKAAYCDLVDSIPGNDINDEEELCLATRFLHENGVLLHFEEQLNGLNQLYFIDCSWLCSLLAKVVTVREVHSFIHNGLLRHSDLQYIFSSTHFPRDLIPQYLQLLEKFEIALSVSDRFLLVPSMLPERPPANFPLSQWVNVYFQQHWQQQQQQGSNGGLSTSPNRKLDGGGQVPSSQPAVHYIQRVYCMAYIPSGFWSRLIARLLLSRIGTDEDGQPCMPLLFSVVTSSAASVISPLLRRKETQATKADAVKALLLTDLVLWSTGVCVRNAENCFCIQSLESELGRRKSRDRTEPMALPDLACSTGLVIHLWSTRKTFPIFPYLVDAIDGLIEEWFPGLCDIDITGDQLVQKMATYRSLTILSADGQAPTEDADELREVSKVMSGDSAFEDSPDGGGGMSSLDSTAVFFPLRTCALAALSSHDAVWKQRRVPLQQLAPELTLSDLPDELLLKPELLEFEASSKTLLGRGGAGVVYRAKYNGTPVAMKQFSTTVSTYRDSPADVSAAELFSAEECEGLSFELLQASDDALTLLRQLRQEITVLRLLKHPCVVRLIGVQLHPICFALELAPMGSLLDLMEKQVAQQPPVPAGSLIGPVFGHVLTHRILLQVATAVRYLHSQDIIYRDLKGDNILVWSLAPLTYGSAAQLPSPCSGHRYTSLNSSMADASRLINVRIADYGISRVATPGGLKGQEGTPGYLAPEAISRNGALLAYDNKVDIFSYGMFVFELLSGGRPFGELDNPTDINRAITNQQRPELTRHVSNTLYPKIEELMEQCWQHISLSRPDADTLTNILHDMSVLCERHRYPQDQEETLEKLDLVSACYMPCYDPKAYRLAEQTAHSAASTGAESQSLASSARARVQSPPSRVWLEKRVVAEVADLRDSVLLWSGSDAERRYTLLDCNNGSVLKKAEVFPGGRVQWVLNVDQSLWIATMTKIEVIGFTSPSSHQLQTRWSKEISWVTSMDTLTKRGKCQAVFVALDNGSIEKFTRPSCEDDVNDPWPSYNYSLGVLVEKVAFRAMLAFTYTFPEGDSTSTTNTTGYGRSHDSSGDPSKNITDDGAVDHGDGEDRAPGQVCSSVNQPELQQQQQEGWRQQQQQQENQQ